jgi:hypothetical protein
MGPLQVDICCCVLTANWRWCYKQQVVTDLKTLCVCSFILPAFIFLHTYIPTRVVAEDTLVRPPLSYPRQFIIPFLQKQICYFRFPLSSTPCTSNTMNGHINFREERILYIYLFIHPSIHPPIYLSSALFFCSAGKCVRVCACARAHARPIHSLSRAL